MPRTPFSAEFKNIHSNTHTHTQRTLSGTSEKILDYTQVLEIVYSKVQTWFLTWIGQHVRTGWLFYPNDQKRNRLSINRHTIHRNISAILYIWHIKSWRRFFFRSFLIWTFAKWNVKSWKLHTTSVEVTSIKDKHWNRKDSQHCWPNS